MKNTQKKNTQRKTRKEKLFNDYKTDAIINTVDKVTAHVCFRQKTLNSHEVNKYFICLVINFPHSD